MMLLRVYRTHRQHEQRVPLRNNLSLGSAAEMDVCLHDSYVSPAHAKVVEDDDGKFWLLDTNSENGIRNRFGSSLGDRIQLVAGEKFELGEHVFEVIDTDHAVQSAPALPPSLKRSLPIALIAYFLLVINSVFVEYLYGFEEFSVASSFRAGVLQYLWLLGLAAGGYAVGVLLRGKGYFWQLLALGAGVALLMEVGTYLLGWLSYNVGGSMVLLMVGFLSKVILLVLTLYGALTWVTHWNFIKRTLACNLLLIAICFDTYIQVNEDATDAESAAVYNELLLNEKLRFAPVHDAEEFRSSMSDLFNEAKQNSTEDD
ncbi:FHA domain-containing protein [Umboniibacter marinipuniceus]|uniref:FHA domain-containing protein n=1 Tax=Umboniibacter marinipuniceus TaxID=569599 RepID=A0A3M0A622_9GAMM|nr:FHA domain-containing protein [Umboniibacter marinipuniceus]RMA80230.1 FHA domain-containing protein [Umboniibacter marinipuniceus]